MNFDEIRNEIMATPEVTKAEAFAAGLLIGDRAESGDQNALNNMMEIVGCACTCSEQEFLRRFIVWQLHHGPIAK